MSLLVERDIYPGGAYTAKVVVDAIRELSINWIKVFLEGKEKVTLGSGNDRRVYSCDIIKLGASLSGATVLQPGKTEFPFDFSLPPEAPASYRGRLSQTEYTLTVWCSIPWWPDTERVFEIAVYQPPNEETSSSPVVFSSDPTGPKAQEAHVEGSLVSSVIEVGGLAKGALALNNVKWNSYTGLSIGLVAFETINLPSQKTSRIEADRYSLELSCENPNEGQSIPFEFRVPESLTPSHRSRMKTLEWWLEVHARVRWHSDVWYRVPVVLISPQKQKQGHKHLLSSPPRVGSERFEEVWREVGHESDLIFTNGELKGTIFNTDLSIRREHRGYEGVFLVAELNFPSLHMGLDLIPRVGSPPAKNREALCEFISGRGLRNSYYLYGRDKGQIRWIRKKLNSFLAIFDIVKATDENAIIEKKGAGQRKKQLLAFVRDVIRFIETIGNCSKDIPPPFVYINSVDAWRDLAEGLGGTLETSRMIVRGRYDDMPVEIRNEWDTFGRFLQTVLILKPGLAFAPKTSLSLSKETFDKNNGYSVIKSASGPAHVFVDRLMEGSEAFELNDSEARLVYRKVIEDPSQFITKCGDILKLCEFLRPERGPFR